MRTFTDLDQLAAAVGEDIGTGDWLEIDQSRIEEFADATGDHQWIHVDADRAAEGPFGATIAHGYLTLSLIPTLSTSTYAVEVPGAKLNYGLNRVRFPNPVRVGSRVRAHAHLVELTEVSAGQQLVIRYTVEIEDQDKPACVAETLVLLIG